MIEVYTRIAQILECENLGLPRCGQDDGGSGVEQLLSIVFLVAGGISMLFILIGAAKFAASSGDPNNIKQARDTIMYAVIGLAVSLLSFSFINFVVGSS